MGNTSVVNAGEGTAASGSAGLKLAYTIPEAVLATGLSRSMIYLAIRSGALAARKCGARTVLLRPDLRRFLRSLPHFAKKAAPPKAPEPQSRQERLRKRAIERREHAA
jgi:hypothetical protein